MAQAVNVNGTLSYLVTDLLGSVSAALDNAGNVTASQLYFPYGGVRYATGTLPTSYAFTGQRQDPSGLDFFNARYYDPTIGQFTSADAFQGPNRYNYVGNNPTSGTDPSGQDACAWSICLPSPPDLEQAAQAIANTIGSELSTVDNAIGSGLSTATGVIGGMVGAIAAAISPEVVIVVAATLAIAALSLGTPTATASASVGSAASQGFSATSSVAHPIPAQPGIQATTPPPATTTTPIAPPLPPVAGMPVTTLPPGTTSFPGETVSFPNYFASLGDITGYQLGPNDLDWQGKGKTLIEALEEAFRRTGVARGDFSVTQTALSIYGKEVPVEWTGPQGAQVNIDWPHTLNGPDVPHVGGKGPGKGAARGHIMLDRIFAGR